MGNKYSSEKLEKIDVKYKGIRKLNEEEIDLTVYLKLKKITLKGNKIVTIPDSICKPLNTNTIIIETLVELDLSHNRLKTIPNEISLLINLRKLHLEVNYIEKLPDDFCKLYRMEKLYLCENKIQFLPPNLKNLRNLKVIDLHCNKLAFLPPDLGEMEWIEEISFDENDDLDENLFTINNLLHLLNYIKSGQVVSKKYEEQYMQYKMKTQEIQKDAKRKDCRYELKDSRLKAFVRMLNDSSDFELYYSFLKKEHSSECLLFYKDCVAFRRYYNSDFPIKTKMLYEKAQEIYKNYIEEPNGINIPADIRNEVKNFIENNNVDQFIFAKAKYAVLKMLLNDSFFRFIETKEGKHIYRKYFCK